MDWINLATLLAIFASGWGVVWLRHHRDTRVRPIGSSEPSPGILMDPEQKYVIEDNRFA